MALLMIGCGAGQTRTLPLPPQTRIRSIDALPADFAVDNITVGQFRRVCDQLARNLVIQPFVTRAAQPPVITIRRLENKTRLDLDEQIFQETIRVKLMEHAQGAVLFRDDVSYRDVLEERMRQSSNEVTMTVTDSLVETKVRDRTQDREFESGSLSGLSGTNERAANVEEERETQFSQEGTVKSRVAQADYFLRGLVYQMREEDLGNPGSGTSYFQYQFRLVDARSGLIVWEKMLDSKMEGEYTPVKTPAQAPGQRTRSPHPAGPPR